MKTLQEDIIDKLKELCSFLDDHLEVDLSRDNWKIRKSLYNDLAILEDHLKRQEKQSQLNEQEAGNYGITDKIIEEAMNVNTPFFGNSGAKVPTVEQKPSESAEEFLQKKYHVEFISADIKASKKILIECMEEYAAIVERRSCQKCAMSWTKGQKQEIPSDEEMNQKAIKYGELKSQHRFGITDYERSEAEIDFLRGYNAAVNDWRERIKK